jgi:hypothetical protein
VLLLVSVPVPAYSLTLFYDSWFSRESVHQLEIDLRVDTVLSGYRVWCWQDPFNRWFGLAVPASTTLAAVKPHDLIRVWPAVCEVMAKANL